MPPPISGSRAVTDVTLQDFNFNNQYFETKGLTSAKWAQLGAGENITHAVVVVPSFGGYFNFTPAVVTFTSGSEQHVRNEKDSALDSFFGEYKLLLLVYDSEMIENCA